MGFDLHGETKSKLCSCGCGAKADVVIEIGKLEVPITNDCMYKMVLELFSFADNIKADKTSHELGSFKDSYGVLTHYGLAGENDDHALIFYNKEKKKGVRIEWDDLYNFVRRTGIND